MAAQTTADMADQTTAERDRCHLMIMTTEHLAMQSGRSTTVSEANGRVSSYLTCVSGTLVALAFIGQVDRLGTTFFLFALVLFPPLVFLGIFTFERVLQTGLEDALYMREMQRIRHYYIDQAPELAGYFLLSTHDDAAGMARDMGMRPALCGARVQSVLSTSGVVAVINSVLVGVVVGLVVGVLVRPALLLAAGLGILVCALALVIHQSYQTARWRALDAQCPVRFPTGPDDTATDQSGACRHSSGSDCGRTR